MPYPGLRILPEAISAARLAELPQAAGNVDPFGRRIDYLRISITDRCNLRCVYCMPAAGVVLSRQAELLSFVEILAVARAARAIGFNKFRITGGEPLVLRDVLGFVRQLSDVTQGALLCLTTNGMFLPAMAQALHDHGLHRLNISLDTLRPERFKALTRRDGLEQVILGIETALKVGFERIKLNAVIVRGVNDDELLDLAELAVRWPVDVRFIEQMPLNGQRDAGFLGADAIIQRLTPHLGLIAVPPEDRHAAAQHMLTGPTLLGRIGVIAPRSNKFCTHCNRLRLTSQGELKGCLLSEGSLDVRPALRGGLSPAGLQDLLRYAIGIKPREYNDAGYGLDRPMSALGG